MNKKKITIISSYNNKKINKKNNINVNYILANDDNTVSLAIKKSYKKSDLIIIMLNNFKSYSKIVKAIKTINIPIVYCAIDNKNLHDKKNKIIKNVDYIMHGFKLNIYEILMDSALKIINYHGEKKL